MQKCFLLLQSGEMEYSYKLVSVVSHFGSSNAGEYQLVSVVSNFGSSNAGKYQLVSHFRSSNAGEYQLVSVVKSLRVVFKFKRICGFVTCSGHYITDVLNMDKRQWYSYDDSNVTRIDERDVRENRTRSGYIFFYVSKYVLLRQQIRASRSANTCFALALLSAPPRIRALYVGMLYLLT